MNYGEVFAELLTNALKREEEELRGLATKTASPRQTVKSVFQYYESWLSVPLAKEALRKSGVPRLDWEEGRVDIKFLDEKDDVVATFEIKFENVPLNGHGRRSILQDFKKQSDAALSGGGSLEHYCVLVLCGTCEDVEGWRPTKLQEFVESTRLSIRLTPVPCPECLKLNDGGCLGVFVVRISKT
jgi:hypothetical protein